jgi:hypothetical protein
MEQRYIVLRRNRRRSYHRGIERLPNINVITANLRHWRYSAHGHVQSPPH